MTLWKMIPMIQHLFSLFCHVSALQRDTVISFGNQSVAMSDTPLIAHRCDYVFEVDGDNVMERPVACYNLCQV